MKRETAVSTLSAISGGTSVLSRLQEVEEREIGRIVKERGELIEKVWTYVLLLGSAG